MSLVSQSGCYLPCFFIIRIFSSPDRSTSPISFDDYLKSFDTLLIVGVHELKFCPPSYKCEQFVQLLIRRPGGNNSETVSWPLLRLRPLQYWRAQIKFYAPFPRFLTVWLELGLPFHAIFLKMVVVKNILYVGSVNGILPCFIHLTSYLDKIL